MRKVVYIQLLHVFTLIAGIFVTPFYFNYLSKERYGFAILFAQIVTYLGIFDLGIGSFLVQRISVHLTAAKSDLEQKELVSKCLGILLAVILILTPFVFLLAFFVDHIFHFDFELKVQTKLLLSVSFLATLFSLFFKPIVSILMAREHLLFNAFSNTLVFFIYSVGALVLLHFKLDINSFLISHLVSLVFGTLVNYIYLRGKWPFDISFIHPQKSFAKEILTPSLFIFINGLAAQIIYNGDRVLVAKFVGITALTLFNLNIRVIEISQAFLIKITDLYIPRIVKTVHSQLHQSINYYNTLTRVIVILTFLTLMNIITFNNTFLKLWLGDSFVLGDSAIVNIYMCAMFSHVVFRIPSLFLFGIGDNKIYATASLADAFLNIVLSILLVPIFQIKGLLLATLIATLVTSVPINIISLKKVFREQTNFRTTLAPIFAPVLFNLPFIFVSFQLSPFVYGHVTSWLQFFVIVVLINCVFVFLLTVVNFRGYKKLVQAIKLLNNGFYR